VGRARAPNRLAALSPPAPIYDDQRCPPPRPRRRLTAVSNLQARRGDGIEPYKRAGSGHTSGHGFDAESDWCWDVACRPTAAETAAKTCARGIRGADRTGPLLGARGGDRCALALISLALDEVDAMGVLRRRGASRASLRRCAARPGLRAAASPRKRRRYGDGRQPRVPAQPTRANTS
jgi:hypothetical protein